MKEKNTVDIKNVWRKVNKAVKIKTVACPGCREELGYATLWFYRKSNVGRCKQCGQRFRISYSPLRFVVFFLLLAIAIFGGVMLYLSGNYNVMFLGMLGLAAIFGIFYLLMPLTMRIKGIRGGVRMGAVDLTSNAIFSGEDTTGGKQ